MGFRKMAAVFSLCALVVGGASHSTSAADRWKKAREVQVRTFGFNEFIGISHSLVGSVEVTQGDLYAVIAESKYTGLLEEIQIEAKDGILELSASEEVRRAMDNMRKDDLFTLKVTMPRVLVLTLGGSGSLKVTSDLQTDGLTIDVAGSGKLETKKVTSVGKVALTLGGSGEAVLGVVTATDVELNMSGSGKIKMADVKAGSEMKVQHAGSGEVSVGKVDCLKMAFVYSGGGKPKVGDVNAKEYVDLQCSGSGNVELGTVSSKSMKMQTSGSGKVLLSGVKVDMADLQIASSGMVEVKGGSSKQCTLNATGSSDVEMSRHSAREMDVSIGGSGSVSVKATKEARVKTMASAPLLTVDGGGKVVLNGAK